MINAVVADAVSMSPRERIMARVEDSARQLGMHIAELREYAGHVAMGREADVAPSDLITESFPSDGTVEDAEVASEESDAPESEVD
ncbi:hypothetical protein ACHAP5_002546 [Fusarium lateritium]